jgi:hypothetical protein
MKTLFKTQQEIKNQRKPYLSKTSERRKRKAKTNRLFRLIMQKHYPDKNDECPF